MNDSDRFSDSEIPTEIAKLFFVLAVTERSADDVIEMLRKLGNDVGVEMSPEAEAAFRRNVGRAITPRVEDEP